jgi:ribosome-associated translation inhibitor RaiA
MIIEISSQQTKNSTYFKRFALLATKRLERFGVPINRVQIRLEEEGKGLHKQEKRCVLSLRGQDDFHVNVKHKGKTFRQAMNASFHHIEQALRRQHSKQRQLRSRQRVTNMPLMEAVV